MYDRFADDGFEVVYVGAFETEEACQVWKEEYDLPFPVVPDDEDGTIFETLTNGWVPWSVLLDPEQKVVFSENEFSEAGFSKAIETMYAKPATEAITVAPKKQLAPPGTLDAAKIVILGGGTGGIVSANYLRKKLKKPHSVTLINKSPKYLYESSLLWQVVGKRSPGSFSRPLEQMSKKGIDVREAAVERIDLSGRVVITSDGEVDYDYLIIALGAELAPEMVPGFDEMALNLYTPEGCTRIHDAMNEFEGGTIGILITMMPFKCPAAPYEAAFLLEAMCRAKGIRNKTEIHLFTPEHIPMPVAPEKLGNAVVKMLEQRGIKYHPFYTFKELRPDTKEIVSSTKGATKIDLLIGIPPHQAPDVIRSSPLLGVSGFIHTNRDTLETEYPGVYAIGDVTTIKLANDKALPKAGVFAHSQAESVAKRIAAEVVGKTSNATFKGKGYCWIEMGDGKASFAGGNFYADPAPSIRILPPLRVLHWGKVAFEKWWLRHWF